MARRKNIPIPTHIDDRASCLNVLQAYYRRELRKWLRLPPVERSKFGVITDLETLRLAYDIPVHEIMSSDEFDELMKG